MPRKPRMFVPGIPAHVVQRGNNRQATFFEKQDYDFYLDVLQSGLRRYDAALHAYCLMSNHVHLLITPNRENSIPRVFQHVGRMYVLYINKKYGRTGALWEGRYKCSLINADEYLLTCYRYIELNPVSAGMVIRPEEYPWSSYRHNGTGQTNRLISEHDVYLGLGNDSETQRHRYRNFFQAEIPSGSEQQIQKALNFNYPLGNDKFREEVEYYLGRPIGKMEGRTPTKSSAD